MRPLLPLALLFLSCARALAEPTATLEQDRARDSAADIVKGQWFDLLLLVDPRGEAIAESGLDARPTPAKDAEFAAAIFPVPDAPGAFTKPFTVRIPVRLGAPQDPTVALSGKTASGTPFAIRATAKLALRATALRLSATVALKAPAVVGHANAVVVRAKVADGYHVYGTQVDLGSPLVGMLLPAPGTRGALPWTGGGPTSPNGKELEGAFSFEIPFTPARSGKADLRVLLDWQACTAFECEPNGIAYLPLSFDAEGASGTGAPGAAKADDAPPGAAGAGSSDAAGAGGLADMDVIRIILAAIGAGLLALLMPCTYPLIPITISFFSKQAEARHRSVVPLALAYGAGIVVIFTAIGLVVGEGLTAADSVANLANVVWLNIVFALLFLVFGLSLLGLFDIRLPSSLDNLAAKASGTGGYLSVFVMGLTLVITSFTCTAPFVGNLLVFASRGGHLGGAILGMAVFGLTMAIPFVVLSLSPKGFQALPKSGEWMKRLKVTLGIVELGLVLKFASNVDISVNTFLLGREIFLILWGASFLAAGLYLFGVFDLLGKGARTRLGPGRAVIALLMLLAACTLGYGAAGARLPGAIEAFLPPFDRNYGEEEPTLKREYGRGFVAVTDDYEEGLRIAKEKGANIFLHFTGYLCINCRLMEEGTFLEEPIQKEFHRFVEVVLHTDGRGKLYESNRKNRDFQSTRFGTIALPYYVLLDPTGTKIYWQGGGFYKARDFLQFLRMAPTVQ